MNEYKAHGSLQLLVGELLYKNQLLREAIASKDETMEFIINCAAAAMGSACYCGIGKQLELILEAIKLRDFEFTRRRSCYFDEFGDVVPQECNDFQSFATLQGDHVSSGMLFDAD